MDPVGVEKFKAMKRYRQERRKQHLLLLLLRYLATMLLLGLLLSCPLWLPHVSSSLKLFCLGPLTGVLRVVSRPECLFIVGNLIVIYLVGEWSLSKSSPNVDIQEEYRRKSSNIDWRGIKKTKSRYSAVDGDLVEEGEKGLSDEIDKKAEDFIARINWKRRLEERRLLNNIGNDST